MKRLLCSFALLAIALPMWAQNAVTVVNGASFQAGAPVAPGMIASAFGAFTGVTAGNATAVPLPRTINNVRVLVNNVEAPLFYVSASQINFQVPAATPTGNRVPVQVIAGSNTLNGSMLTFDASPGLFVTDFNNAARPGAIQNQDSSANTQQNRASRGQVIIIYGTGSGPLSAVIADGTPAGRAVTTTAAPRVYVSSVEATVEYSGLQADNVGLWQVNVRVPNQAFISGQVPVTLVHNGLPSNTVTLWIAE